MSVECEALVARTAASLGRSVVARIRASTALIVGCGGVGSTVAEILARSGVGKLILVDPDRVDPTNLGRGSLFTVNDVGEFKAVAAARRLEEMLGGCVRVEAVTEPFEYRGGVLLGEADVVVAATDNLESRLAVSDAAARARKPWVYASAEYWQALVITFRPDEGAGPCLRCALAHEPLGSRHGVRPIVAPAAATAASIAASEVLKILAGAPAPPRMITLDLLHGAAVSVKLPPEPCPHHASGGAQLEGQG